MKNTTPRIPIRLPTNSIVLWNSDSRGAQINAIKAPTTIIGIPTPTVIALEAMLRPQLENYMKFMISMREICRVV